MNFADIKDGYMYNVTGHKKPIWARELKSQFYAWISKNC